MVAERRTGEPVATIVCVHGGLDRGGSFARLARRTNNFDLVAFDRRGYQGSRALSPVTFDLHIDDLVAVATREAGRAPVILFGHSFGGVITFAAAQRHPGLAALVVNYEASLPWVLARPSGRPAPTDDAPAEAERFFRRMVSNGAWERLSESEREARRLDGPALLVDLAVLRGDAPFELTTLSTPAAYVHGDWQLAPYYRALCLELEKLNPSIATIEMVKAGHGAHLSNPDQLANLIATLWDRQCASG